MRHSTLLMGTAPLFALWLACSDGNNPSGSGASSGDDCREAGAGGKLASSGSTMDAGPCIAGAGSGGTVTFGCDSTPVNHICSQFDAPAASIDQLKMSCTGSTMGTVVASCPTANLLGTCAQMPMGGVGVKVYYYSYPGGPTAGGLMQGCQAANGTWSAGA